MRKRGKLRELHRVFGALISVHHAARARHSVDVPQSLEGSLTRSAIEVVTIGGKGELLAVEDEL